MEETKPLIECGNYGNANAGCVCCECEEAVDGQEETTIRGEQWAGDIDGTCASNKEQRDDNVEFIEVTDTDSLPKQVRKFYLYGNIKRMVAKKDFTIMYKDNGEEKTTVIKEGTLGGFIGENASIRNSWLDENSFVIAGEVINSYLVNTKINNEAYITDSYLIGVSFMDFFKDCNIHRSTVVLTSIAGNSTIYDSLIKDTEINGSDVTKCNLEKSELVESKVKNIETSELRVDFAEINGELDLFMCGPIGMHNRIVCAYKTKRGGVRVSTGCFRGTLEELVIANAKTHLKCEEDKYGYLVRPTDPQKEPTPEKEWTYTEYDLLIQFIKHHFKLDRMTTPFYTNY